MPLLLDITPLRVNAAYRRLYAGLTLSGVGAQLATIAIGLQVYDLTGSTAAVGLVGLFALVPLVVMGLYGGALVDRHDRRTVALVAASVLWLVAAGNAAQAWLGNQHVAVLYGLVAAYNAGFGVVNPARQAIYPRLLPRELLPAANALSVTAMNVTFLIGPLLAGVLVDAGGFRTAYTVDAVLFTGAMWGLWRLPPVPPEPESRIGPERGAVAGPSVGADALTQMGSPADEPTAEGTPAVHGTPAVAPAAGAAPRYSGVRSVLDGLRFLASRPNVRMTFLADLAAMVLAQPRALLPAIAALVLGGGASTVGLLTAGVAAGGLVAMTLSGPLGRVRRQGLAVVVSVVGWGVAFAGFGAVVLAAGRLIPVERALWLAVAAMAVAGAADAISAVFRTTILQSATPDHLRGRLQGVFIVVVAGGPRLGEMVTGFAASWLGEGTTALLGGLACVVVVLVLAGWQRGFLRYDAAHPTP